jgi:tyrosinase
MTEPYVRVDVWTLAEDDPIITAYAGAVAAMQQKSSNADQQNDPTGWVFQAALHGTESGPPRAPATPPANQCQHDSWYFMPWHRMYVYYFEQIVRAYVIANGGPSNWALPYWNYDGGGDSAMLPPAFRDTSSPLYTPQRAGSINAGAPMSPAVTSAAAAFALTTFTGAGEFGGGNITAPLQFYSEPGQLEQTPHNVVHTTVGGSTGLMSNILAAAQDPIFWLHHANIDRLWWQWAQQNSNSNPSDPAWLNQDFLSVGGFFDGKGNPIQTGALTCGAVQDPTSLPAGYTYDQQVTPQVAPMARVSWPSPWPERPQTPAPASTSTTRHLLGATERQIRLVGEAVTVPVTIDERVTTSLRADHTAERRHRVFLDMEDIDAARNPGIVYGIYINLPSHPTDADLEAHHAGNLSLFGIEVARNPRRDEHPHNMRISMDITRLLDRLAATGAWSDGRTLVITLQPITPGVPPGRELADEIADTTHQDVPVTIGRISIHYA